jgi:hypothetical protein
VAGEQWRVAGLGQRRRHRAVRPADVFRAAVAESRATMAGFYLGAGLCALLLGQPFIYMTLGLCWLFTAFGRIVSMLSDRGNTFYNWVSLIVELALAALPLGFAFGLLA